MPTLIQELKQAILEELEIDDIQVEDLTDDSPLFVEGLGLDSIDALEIVVLLEKRYAIRLTDMETARAAFSTFATLAEFVARHRADGAGTA